MATRKEDEEICIAVHAYGVIYCCIIGSQTHRVSQLNKQLHFQNVYNNFKNICLETFAIKSLDWTSTLSVAN